MADRSTIQEQYAVQEMKQRVHHVLRRANRNHTEFRFKDLYMDLRAHRVWRAGQEVELTPREFALLEQLMRNRGAALYRDVLYERVWGAELADTRTLDLHIQRLRKKLGWRRQIRTVFRVGYMLQTDEGLAAEGAHAGRENRQNRRKEEL